MNAIFEQVLRLHEKPVSLLQKSVPQIGVLVDTKLGTLPPHSFDRALAQDGAGMTDCDDFVGLVQCLH